MVFEKDVNWWISFWPLEFLGNATPLRDAQVHFDMAILKTA